MSTPKSIAPPAVPSTTSEPFQTPDTAGSEVTLTNRSNTISLAVRGDKLIITELGTRHGENRIAEHSVFALPKSVTIDGSVVGEIGKGFLVLLGVHVDDTEAEAERIADRICGLRIFEDADDKMNLSLSDVGGDVLLVSQFTLLADARKGRRPSHPMMI